MRSLKIIVALLLCVPLAGCFSCHWTSGPFAVPDDKQAAKKAATLYLEKTDVAALPGWDADANAANAIPALQKSCAKILNKKPEETFGPLPYAGTYGDWQKVCASLDAATPVNTLAARQFMTDNFTPYAVYGPGDHGAWDKGAGDKGAEGLFTGYYEPLLHGSYKKTARYNIPLYARPADLVTVHLGDFKPALKGETVMGRVTHERLVPYYTRAQIDKGALGRHAQRIVWVDNAVDAFFLHIQGSGVVKMTNGAMLRVGYAAENGRAYTAIGRALVAQGALAKANVSMQSIRAWLEAHPKEAPKVMDINESFIFFQKLDKKGKPADGPLGAEGVTLTPRRSMAVDRHLLPYGAPLWLDAEAPGNAGARLQRLMIAQDTGGAIAGAVRGDFFWGNGAEATQNAGIMKSAGRYYIFLPKTVVVPASYLKDNSSPWFAGLSLPHAAAGSTPAGTGALNN